MNSNPLILRIAEYRYCVGDEEFWHEILKTHSISTINAALSTMLLSGSDSETQDACLFTRDLILVAPRSALQDAFAKQFLESPIVQILEKLLRAPSLFQRQAAAYTLGKTGSKTSARLLRTVLLESQESDPIFLHDLAFEISWLEDEMPRGDCFAVWFDQNPMRSNSKLTRWASLDVIDSLNSLFFEPYSEVWNVAVNGLLRLSKDEDDRVSASASFLLEEVANRTTMSSTEDLNTEATETLEDHRPLFFSDLSLRFVNHMSQAGRNSYDLAELTAFAAKTENFG